MPRSISFPREVTSFFSKPDSRRWLTGSIDDNRTLVKPGPFKYFQPTTVAEAVSLLGTVSNSKVLAGGQSLVPAMNFRLARPTGLIDINRVEDLPGITVRPGSISIGALARHRDFEKPIDDGPLGRLLAMAARHVGHLPIRIRGTFVGSLAHADPASEWCVIARTLDAEMVARSETGDRTVAAADFFQTAFTTTLRPAELLTAVGLPTLASNARVGFAEFSRRTGDFALVMAAVVLEIEDGSISSARVGIGGATDKPIRMDGVENRLIGAPAIPETSVAIAAIAAEEVDPLADIHASSDYRRDLVRAMTRRALDQAIRQPEPTWPT